MPLPQEQDQVEVEWQFEAPDVAEAAAWVASTAVPGYSVVAKGVKSPRDTYFDTATWAVHRGGFTCRVRDRGDSAELTLKTMAESDDGVRSRREMTEQLDAANRRDPLLAPGTCGQFLRLLAGRAPLVPLFTLEQTRHIFALEDDQGLIAEIAVDDTAILRDGAESARIARLEVEIEPGALNRARGYVAVLAASLHLRSAPTSKFAAGLAVAGLAPTAPAVPGPTAVTPAMTAAEAAFAVLRKQFAVFLANEPGTRLGEDIEALHDMRVATRRTRAALSAFGPFLPARMQPFRAQLGRIAAVLGEVRDLDVQLERAREWEAALPARAPALQPVEDLLRTRREAARRRMLLLLNSRWYEQVTARYAAALERGPASSGVGHGPVLAVGPALIEGRHRTLVQRGRRIRRSSPPADYHRLRIDAKKLRYALEFLGPLYGKPAAQFTTRLVALQDLLGTHQDAEVAIETLDTMARTVKRLPPETLVAMGAVAERYRSQAAALRKQFPGEFKPLEGREWRALRKAVERKARTAPDAG